MAFNNLAVGNKVYNGGSNSANRGQTLDPSGYVQRGLMQRIAKRKQSGVGNTPGVPGSTPAGGAASTARSGLAASALTNIDNQNAPQPGGNPNVGGLAPINLASQGGTANLGASGAAPFVNQIRSFDTAGVALKGSAPSVRLPGIPTSVIGQLKSKLDADYRMKKEQGYNTLTNTIAKLQNALAKMGTEYQSTLRDANAEGKKDYAALAAQYAAMGGGPGTAYGQDYQDLTTTHANFLNDLNTWFSQGQQDVLTDRTGAVNDFQTLLRGLIGLQGQRDAAERAAAALAKKQAAAKAAKARSSRSTSSSRGRPRYSSSGGSRSRPSSRSSSSRGRSSSYKAPAKKKKNYTVGKSASNIYKKAAANISRAAANARTRAAAVDRGRRLSGRGQYVR